MIVLVLALAQQVLPTPAPPFRLQSPDFLQAGMGVSTLAFRADHEGGLDVTQTPCEGRYVLSFTDRTPTPFHVNSVHTFLHRVEMNGVVFDSDNVDPLVFRVEAEGYTWVRGKGNVTVPAGAKVTSKGVTVSPDQRTHLLPPGRTTADLAGPKAIQAGERIVVCGRQLQLMSMTALAGGTGVVVRFGLGSGAAFPTAAANRVMVALLDEKRQRYKPKEATPPLTWATITQFSGVPFEMPARPVALEVEGMLVDIRHVAIQPEAK